MLFTDTTTGVEIGLKSLLYVGIAGTFFSAAFKKTSQKDAFMARAAFSR